MPVEYESPEDSDMMNSQERYASEVGSVVSPPLRAACIHGNYFACSMELGIDWLCPGGREVTIDYEAVAAVEHDQWTRWSMSLVQTEELSDDRVTRWTRLWNTAYTDLTESEKESDRKWARKAVTAAIGDTDEREDPWGDE